MQLKPVPPQRIGLKSGTVTSNGPSNVLLSGSSKSALKLEHVKDGTRAAIPVGLTGRGLMVRRTVRRRHAAVEVRRDQAEHAGQVEAEDR